MKERSIFDDFRVSLGILGALLCVVVAIWLWLPGFLTRGVTEASDRGLIGDSFGSVNALFTGLAFAGLIFTILLQHRAIRLQRADFAAQIEQMKLSRGEVARQVQLQSLQLKVAVGDLKMKAFEAEIAALEMESHAWRESARATEIGPKIRDVKRMMDELNEALEEELNAQPARPDNAG